MPCFRSVGDVIFHITRTASYFIKQVADEACIKKIYLPITEAVDCKRVQVVACAHPSTAVDYVRSFIEVHKDEIEQRRNALNEGRSKDAFLLILSPTKAVDFYKLNDAKKQLFDLIKPYQQESRKFSDDYYKVLNYYALARYPNDNFTFRKVLYHEGIGADDLLPLLQSCIMDNKSFATLATDNIKSALQTASAIRDVLDSDKGIAQKIAALSEHIQITEPAQRQRDLENSVIDQARVEAVQHQEEEEAELEEIAIKQMAAIELMTIVGSKGLSADYVIIIGFDNVNMKRVIPNP